MPEEIRLQVFDAGFVIQTPDEDWLKFLTQLWAPFQTTDGPKVTHHASITGGEGAWGLEGSGLAPTTDDDPWRIADELRHFIVETSLQAPRSFVDLHAASLVRDGIGLVLPGGTKSGKTTLALELVERGWRFYSDDIAPIDKQTGMIRPFPKPLGIRDLSTWQTYSDRWDPPPWPPRPRGSLLVPATVMPLELARETEARGILFPTFRGTGSSAIEDMTEAEAVTRCSELVRDVDEEVMGTLVRFVEGKRIGKVVYVSSADVAVALNRWLV